MAEGTDAPRPRRAFAIDDTAETPAPETMGRRGVWPEADRDQSPAPVSRRAWSRSEPSDPGQIQQVSAPARRVRITPAPPAGESPPPGTHDAGIPEAPIGTRGIQPPEGVTDFPTGRRGRPAPADTDEADDDAPPVTGRRGWVAEPARPTEDAPLSSPSAAPSEPVPSTPPAPVSAAFVAPSEPEPSEPGAPSVATPPAARTASGPAPSAATPPSATAPVVAAHPAASSMSTPPAAGSPAPSTPQSADPAESLFAPDPWRTSADTAGRHTPPPMPTLQPPSYTKQPAPAPQEPAPEPVGPVPAAKIAGPARPPKFDRGKRAGAPSRAKAGHLVEWDAPTDSSLDKRTRFSLSLAGVAALLIVAVAIGYAVISGRDVPVATQPGGSEASTMTRPPDPFPSERMMLNDASAKQIADQAWKISLTQEGLNEDSPRPSCIRMSVDGAPVPRATMLRTLTTSGDEGATALHIVDTYATADEAEQVFTSRLTQLGKCDKEPTLLTGGYTITDIGDEAVGVTTVVEDDKDIRHTIMVARTGTAVNIIDIAQPKEAVGMDGLAKAMAGVIDTQCTAAVGLCSLTPRVSQAPPPADGGDPGFLSPADIPRITSGAGSWSANPATSDITAIGSQCEGVSSWGSVSKADDTRQTTYLLMDDPASPTAFGMDEVLLTMESEEAAESFVTELHKSMGSCSDRMLTASMEEPVDITGHGARGAEVKGHSYRVTQDSGNGELDFRVGIVSSNNKVAYLLLPLDGEFDFTDDQWQHVVSRAGERISQVR